MTSCPMGLSPKHLGIVTADEVVRESLEVCNDLLRKNHTAFHIFYRDPSFHNHMDRYDDLVPTQRRIPDVDEEMLRGFCDPDVFYHAIGQVNQYTTFLEFFRREINAKGSRAVVLEYVFSRTKVADRMLAQLIEGVYHPIIHLGFGIEFQLDAIVAEALAQAAAHDQMLIEHMLFAAEREAAANPIPDGTKPKSLIELVHEVRANEAIRTAPRWSDLGNKMKDGIVGRACDDIARILGQFQIAEDEETLHRRTAEMISTCAYIAGAVSRDDRQRRIDFFVMHCVTSSIFCTVLGRQDWIPLADRVRVVKWKARMDLAWYAATGSAPLDGTAITGYSNPLSDGLGWQELFRLVRAECDDGHAAKFIRALKNGEEVSRAYEEGEWAEYFPVKGGMWLKMASLCQDSTTKRPWETKWVFFAGFEEAWQRP